MDLYFINSEEEQVAVVRGAIAEPVIENQTIKGRPFAVNVPLANRTTDMVIPVPALAGGGAFVYASAVPIIGGMVSSLFHCLLVTPAIFSWLRQRELFPARRS